MNTTPMNLDLARTVADAVLYEGYLLYPYRASSAKNRSRWQFGVLGPPGAAEAGVGEASSMSMQCLLDTGAGEQTGRQAGSVAVRLRFLQLQVRTVEKRDGDGYRAVEELTVDETTWLSWDEAAEQELALEAFALTLGDPVETTVETPGGEEIESLTDASGVEVGRVVRRRWPLVARVTMTCTAADGHLRLEVRVVNDQALSGVPDEAPDKERAIRTSLIGAHLLLEARGAGFVSLLEPPEDAVAAAAGCRQDRCWPVLTGAPGDRDLVLGSPIILYDYPQVAPESAGALFDSTEIDEILTLRVMTMTEAEKREARATDPRAREIIDRCDEMSPETLQQLHGVLRDPHAPTSGSLDTAGATGSFGDLRNLEPASFDPGDVPWWDPAADEAVRPETDAVVIDGIRVAKGSLVRVHPSRRADAQDLFFADQVARVTAVLADVDGGVHVALVLVDDPAADLHEWYGRYFYFAPDELEPLPVDATQDPDEHTREEIRP